MMVYAKEKTAKCRNAVLELLVKVGFFSYILANSSNVFTSKYFNSAVASYHE